MSVKRRFAMGKILPVSVDFQVEVVLLFIPIVEYFPFATGKILPVSVDFQVEVALLFIAHRRIFSVSRQDFYVVAEDGNQ